VDAALAEAICSKSGLPESVLPMASQLTNLSAFVIQGVDAAVAEAMCGKSGCPESVLPTASQLTNLTAEKTGYVSGIHAMSIGLTSCRLGSGKEKSSDIIGMIFKTCLQNFIWIITP